VSRDGREREVRIDGTLLTIGRSPDNGLALDDARVSRHHARLRARHGMLVLTDLDSTNGVRVNGVRVAEVALGVGDRIEIGDTVLVVDAVAPD
jgi:pSer/pThr/pTyr-binding forkhead associated (FHA) protein